MEQTIDIGIPIWQYVILFGGIALSVACILPVFFKAGKKVEEKQVEKISQTFDQLATFQISFNRTFFCHLFFFPY